MVEKSNSRIPWIDGIKLFAIYLMVWGHCLLDLGYEPSMSYTGINGLIYSFHMPLFMTISGYLSVKLIKRQGDVRKKFIQLIIPCITLGLLCQILKYDQNFWYLKSLFLCYIVTDIYYHINFHGKGVVFFILCLLLFPILSRYQYLYKIDFMLPFFFFGLYLSQKKEWIIKNRNWLIFFVGLLFLFCEFFWSKQFVYYFSKPNWIDYRELVHNKTLVLDIRNFGCSFMRYFAGLVGSLFFILLFQFIFSKKNPIVNQLTILSKWGQYSLHIYILQCFLVSWGVLPVSFPITPRAPYDFIYTPIYAVIVTVICILLALLLEKNRYINFFLFGKNLK